MREPRPEDLPLHDLHTVIRLGLARGGDLLTAGELATARGLLALSGPPGRLYARLSTRRPRCFRLEDLELAGVDDPGGAARVLAEAHLVDRAVPWTWRARALTNAELADACRRLGLRRSGRKDELVARLAGHTGWVPGTWIRLRHLGLVRRLERWAFLRRRPDRATLVVDRLGVVRWPEYALTPGAGLHPDRAALRRWEALLDPEQLEVDVALQALRSGWHRAPGRLDLGRALRSALRRTAHALEADDPDGAATLYEALVDAGERAGRVAFRRARALEAAGRPDEALSVLRAGLDDALPSERVALGRAGRRLARSQRAGWAPDPPLKRPRRRTVRLTAAASEGRPRWTVGDRALTVEAATCAWLREHGRRALHVEGSLWSTIFALLFADTYFLPVSGALPVPYLPGPLDLDSPAFRARREEAVAEVLAAVLAGEAPDRVREADARWRGTRLARARWHVADGDTLASIASGIGPRALHAILERILSRGRRATRGLPDLVVLPGPPRRLDAAWPTRLHAGLVLVEVKGPGDQVRDEQAVWLDALLRARTPVELWEVVPR